ncbi:MAG: hypothetical protein WC632_03860 [Candidatus Margulisiibacteriota bacterium]
MDYFYNDIIMVVANLSLLLFLFGFMVARRRFTHGGNLLLLLIILLSTLGLSDLIFQWNPNLPLILLANSLNIFCALFTLSILCHFSLFAFTRSHLLWESRAYLWLYLPPVIISFLYALSPLMLTGIVQNPLGFRLLFGSGYWAIVICGAALTFAISLLELAILFRPGSADEKAEAGISLAILLLLAHFFNLNLILPFFVYLGTYSSPMPAMLATLLLAYEFIRYNYYSLGNSD